MMPTTSGPCRLGKYAEVVREFLDNEDMHEIPVMGCRAANRVTGGHTGSDPAGLCYLPAFASAIETATGSHRASCSVSVSIQL